MMWCSISGFCPHFSQLRHSLLFSILTQCTASFEYYAHQYFGCSLSHLAKEKKQVKSLVLTLRMYDKLVDRLAGQMREHCNTLILAQHIKPPTNLWGIETKRNGLPNPDTSAICYVGGSPQQEFDKKNIHLIFLQPTGSLRWSPLQGGSVQNPFAN